MGNLSLCRRQLTEKQGAVYGKCVAANYQNAKKDMCAREFLALKDCYLVSVNCMLLEHRTDSIAESRKQKVIIFMPLA